MARRYPLLGLLLILVGVAGLLFVSALGGSGSRFGWGSGMMGHGMMGGWAGGAPARGYGSNGAALGVSARTGPVPTAGGPMWFRMRGGGCVACHGVGGRGGVPVMMGTAIPSDIRYEALTGEAHHESDAAREHPPYTDALIRRAITEGADPAGSPLDWTMPRWRMPQADLDDLLAYLRTLR